MPEGMPNAADDCKPTAATFWNAGGRSFGRPHRRPDRAVDRSREPGCLRKATSEFESLR